MALIGVIVAALVVVVVLRLLANNTNSARKNHVAKKQKTCGGCQRVMLPAWTKCMFCGWAPVARLEFILGPMANQTLS